MQRIIAYIYRYKESDGVYTKCANSGFCRVMMCTDECMVNICFKDTSKVTGKYKIYEFKIPDKKQSGCIVINMEKEIGEGTICDGQMNTKVLVGHGDGLFIECGSNTYVVFWGDTPNQFTVTKEDMNIPENIVEDVGIEPESSRETEQVKIEVKVERETEKKVQNPMIERAFSRLCKVRFLIEGKERAVVKLRPQDMLMLPRHCWRLTSNPFLMEGYYVHKHILLYREEKGFVLAVPGSGREQEEVYAKRCGFVNKTSGGDFGKKDIRNYYYLYL